MAKYHDGYGGTHEVAVSLDFYRRAQNEGVSVEALVNREHPVKEGEPSAFTQMVASLGMCMRTDRQAGIHASKLGDVLNGTLHGAQAANNTAPSTPESRIIFPAAILSAVEDKLARDLTTAASAFDRMVAQSTTIPGKQYTRIITNYDRPEAARNRATAQLARPANMALLTASERPGVVPAVSLGIEWSDEVMMNTTIDFVALSLARQVGVQRYQDAQDHTIALLNGDEDVGQAAIPAAYRHKAVAFDTGITAAGELTQKAWVKWLYNGSSFRQIDWIITDIDTALAIENREGKPVVVGDDATSPRIDSQMRIANPLIPANVNVFVTTHPDWPAGTIMGFQRSQAIQRVISLSANYQAVEQDVIRRANSMRWDSGSIAYRLYDEAFSVLTLTL